MTYSRHARRQDGALGPGGPEHYMTPVPSRALSSVKRQLTPDSPRKVTENDEYAAFLRRVLRAYGRRIAAGDIDALADMAAMAGGVIEVWATTQRWSSPSFSRRAGSPACGL